ncbi:type II secretion system protein GspM [Bryobacter aggregatus]|uniref:type II secretion system protein GspM n=1 Tax=Bryobacter aggregatus TaxID=360054 RepID=UPI0004E12E5E|nr:type II secretion system protein GspM [Bryobacter aggregatus]
MNLSDREQRLVKMLIPSVIICAFVYFWPEGTATPSAPLVADTAASIELAQARLAKARLTAAQVPSKEAIQKKLDGELASWEKRLIQADTPAQAQAQLLQIFRRIARLQGNTVEMRGSDLGSVQPVNSYAQIAMTVSFDCQIEGLVNLLSDIASQPEFLSWRDLYVSSPDSKLKRISVSMTFIGLAPAKLIPKPTGVPRG